jgi:tetratricopeptide (TPR) repeat protein
LARKRRREKAQRSPAVTPEQPRFFVTVALRNTLLASAALCILVFVIYAQVRSHQFVDFDDPLYVSKNAHVLQGLTWSGIVWAFTHVYASYWLPLTWISHMLDVQLFGVNAGAHLLVSAALHAINCVLLLLFLKRTTGAFWRSVIVAALFAVHPLHVESVAWIAERKDTLSTLLFLSCLIAYAQYVLRNSRLAYATSVLMLALGLMAKPMLVTTPFVLLLLDYWPLHRYGVVPVRKLALEKVPHALSVIGGIGATLFGQHEAMSSTTLIPLTARLANAAMSYVAYVAKTFWPAKLAFFYPFPTYINPWLATFDAILILAITAIAFRFYRSLPELFVGWCWFLGTLVPVIGLAQAGQQAMADRFVYIPHIGLFIAIVWTASRLVERAPSLRPAAIVAAATTIMILTGVAHAQVGYWKGSIPLYEHTLEVTSNDNKLAQVNLAAALLEAGDNAAAEQHYEQAIGYRPQEIVYDGLALALIGQGKLAAATRAAESAVKANPNSAEALAMLGSVELSRGDTANADRALSRSLRLKPAPAVAARLALARGQLDQARAHFAEAIEADPRDADLRNDYAAVLARLGSDAEARSQYEEALAINSNSYDARMNYGALLSRLGRNDAAAQQFADAARLRPRSPEPHVYLALLEAGEHRFDLASHNIESAIAIDHDASNALLINAIRIPPRPTAIDEYLTFLRQQSPHR